MIKINSGIFRNSSIETLKNSSFRPTTSICRKSFFDTIGPLEKKSFLDIFVENALKKLNKGGMLIIECSSKETLEGFDKIAKFGDTNLLYWKV